VIDEMAHALASTARFLAQSTEDLTDEEMVEQPSGVPNHASWTLGHVIFSCQEMAVELGVARWLPDDWESVFGFGSTPYSEGNRYPKKAELLALLADATTRLKHALSDTNPSVLSRELGSEDFPTMGHVLLQVIVAHTAYHAGQLAVWRRAMGKKSVAVFV
jgi:hypothetical protein